MITREDALRIRRAINKAAASLEDIDASSAAELFPRLKRDGSLIKVGTRINWRGVIKKAAVDLWDTAENDPDNAPTLWEDIAYRGGYRIIPEVITATSMFALDEKGWWGDELYRSTIAGNVWTPVQNPTGWEKVR